MIYDCGSENQNKKSRETLILDFLMFDVFLGILMQFTSYEAFNAQRYAENEERHTFSHLSYRDNKVQQCGQKKLKIRAKSFPLQCESS